LSELEIFPNIRLEVEAKSEQFRTIDWFWEICEGLHLEAVLIVVDEEGIVIAKWNVVKTL